MARYVLSFRSQADRTPSAEEEAAWGKWFEEIGPAVADFGNRVGRTTMVGGGSSGTAQVLSGYVVVNASSLDDAAKIASGCPGLRNGGLVEVGEVVPT